ncbi:hypothetical protein [Marmoricola sp. URHB0036]|uniref:DUF7144 family membrane protein n=1 Tax=Marmoricola sp. URHB0036 TaxID=1298863 RepID=UPI0004296DEB|nr:hypothetical protein [Marmoricola sp. URHB0036]
MSTTSSHRDYENSTKGAWALGGAAFAGVMLATLGAFQALQGIAAIADDEVYVRGIKYAYQFDLTTWGWIHLILGVVAIATGIGILAQQTWANAVGIAIAFLSALSSFAFMPYYPFWSITILAFDIFVIWALCSILAND